MLFVPLLPIKAAELIDPDVISFPLCPSAEPDVLGGCLFHRGSSAHYFCIIWPKKSWWTDIWKRRLDAGSTERNFFIFPGILLVGTPGCGAFNGGGTFEHWSKVFQKGAQKRLVNVWGHSCSSPPPLQRPPGGRTTAGRTPGSMVSRQKAKMSEEVVQKCNKNTFGEINKRQNENLVLSSVRGEFGTKVLISTLCWENPLYFLL